MWELLLIKALGAAFVIAIFAGMAFLLRSLYGPKGRLREREWDGEDKTARPEPARQEDEKAEAALRRAFLDYTACFFSGNERDDAPLRLKVDHTLAVARHAGEIAAQEPDFAAAGLARALRLAALFHDVGRFEQLRRFRTFADDLSCNHALLGARIIREQRFLSGEERKIRGLALAAVAAHNRVAVPKTLSGPLRPVLLGLRDADKLDILRIMADNLGPGRQGDSMVLLHLRDEPKAYSPSVFQALEEGNVALYRDMRFTNDFRILLCTWLHDLHFPTTHRILAQEGWLHHIIDGLEALPELRERLRTFVSDFSHPSGTDAGASADRR